jgi:hypothetical protein
MERYEGVYKRLWERSAQELAPVRIYQDFRMATVEAVELAHDLDFIRSFVGGKLTEQQVREIGFPWSQELVDRTFRITGRLSARWPRYWRFSFSSL